MVLQREVGAPIWGWADPGEAVTVAAGQERAAATAGKDGKWSVKLSKLATSEKPIEITITGKNKITLHDVLVGDVWVCSGQSNMELGSGAIVSKEEVQRKRIIRRFASSPSPNGSRPRPPVTSLPRPKTPLFWENGRSAPRRRSPKTANGPASPRSPICSDATSTTLRISR